MYIFVFGSVKVTCSTDASATRDPLEASPEDQDEVEMERCPNCWKLFPVHELPLHSPICQDAASKKRKTITSSSSPSSREEAALLLPDTSRKSPAAGLANVSECLEQCPHCLDLFPLEALISHAETCSMASSTGSTRSSSVGRPISGASVDGDEAAALPVSVFRDTSMEQCPYCSELLPITELITHCTTCGAKSTILPTAGTISASEAMADLEADSVAAKRARYTLEPFDRSAAVGPLSSVEDTRWSMDGPIGEGGGLESASGAAAAVMDRGKPRSLPGRVDELEQCVHCLKEFPISELVSHAALCSAAAEETGAEVQQQ